MVVGVGASVLGNVTLGNNVKVGGGAVVVRDVPADCTVVGVPGHVVTRGGVRVRSAAGERLTVIHNDSPATIDKVIREREDVEHREFLPDPLDNTVDDLQATVERLEKRVAELERMLMRVNDGRKGMPADQPTALAGRPARPEAYPPLDQQPSPTADASQATHEKE